MVGPGPNPLQAVGIVYSILFLVVAVLLWRAGRFTRPARYLLLAVTVFLGFAIFSPMLPHQFQELVARSGTHIGANLVGGAFGIALVVLLTFLSGRHFCGYLCPVGAVQELAYLAPVPKLRTCRIRELGVVRGIVFVIVIGAGLGAGVSVLSVFGIAEFFRLTLSAGFLAFVAVLACSLFFYRPFCRLFCPLGALFQVAAVPGLWKLRRTSACISCGRCERACPTGEAGPAASKGECYLCRRCIEACPVEGAIVYGGASPGEVREPE
ncbi:MAG: 4Fe-4S binding protein [Methanospirillum sp.]|nr:4Fe-4S binding protein [Methanospirillum sp.]